MLEFTIKLQKGSVLVMKPESTKSNSVCVTIKDAKGNVISYGYVSKNDLKSFCRAL